MKYTFKIMLSALLITTSFGCKKQLDLFPYDSIAVEQSFQSVKDATAWNNGMYAFLRGRVYGIYTFSTDVQGDQLNASLDFGNRNGGPHRWDFNSDDYTIRDVWAGYYAALRSINIFLKSAPRITPANETEDAQLKRYVADAHFFRAYYYLNLVLRWAKAYDPATAAADPGVPLVLEYDPEAKPARSSVKEVYDQIIVDINSAKAGLTSVTGALGSKRATIDAVLALEARVKLYMRDWAGAKAAADAVIATGKYPLVTTEAAMKTMWVNDGTAETILQLNANATTETVNTNGIYLGYIAQTKFYRPDFIPSKWVVDEYPSTDIRKPVYFKLDSLDIQGIKYRNIYLVHKFEGNPALFTGAATNYAHAPKIFRIAEMYLIAAEAGYRAASEDALTRLNQLRISRGLTSVNVSGAALFAEIKSERFRELAFEGFRLDDLKRWNEGFTRRDPQNTTILTTGANYFALTKEAGDNKFVWGVPANDMTINTNLVQNPGW